MKELRDKKYFGLMAIISIIIVIVGIISIKNYDFNKGLVKVSSVKVNDITSLSASVNDIVSENKEVAKGYDEITYQISYSLSKEEGIETRPVVIKATLSPEESKYASFIDITKENIKCILNESKSEIEININNAKVGSENTIDLLLKITNAPNGYIVNPKIQIKEISEEKYNEIISKEVVVETNSITGIVFDEKSMPVSFVEISLNSDGKEIKRTYTDENGRYVFSDLENKNYTIEVEEEKYKKESEEYLENSNLNIYVKNIIPYQIEINKYVNSITVNGSKYNYGKISKVQQSIKNLKSITGEVEYLITIKNIGEKDGVITLVKDEMPEGLMFDKNKNPGFELENNIIYNRNFEGITLKPKEEIELKLILDFRRTEEAKTYINTITAKGEVYQKVVFMLDNKVYKEKDVLDGEKISEEKIDDEKFTGWYTDKNYTNKYNFNYEVNKDLILYGKTVEPKVYKIEFYDNNKKIKELSKIENEILKEKELPEVSKTGYTFKYWSLNQNGEKYKIETPIKSDIKLYSVYDINKYKVEFYDKDKKIKTIEKEYNSNIISDEVPEVSKEGYSFIGWYEENEKDTFDFTTKITKNIKLYSKYKITSNAVIFNDENRITTKEVEYGSVVEPIKDQGKTGYTFSHWSEEINGTPFDFNTPIKETTTLYTVYTINKYKIEFIDQDNLYNTQEVEYQSLITKPENPSKIGHTFKYWSLEKDGSEYNLETKVTKNIKLYSVYEINTYTVNFINDGLEYKTEIVKYNDKVSSPQNPSKENNIFLGWLLNNNLYDFNLPVTNDITLYSSYEKVENPNISHTPTEWTNDKVIVTISSSHDDYSYIYKINAEDYQEYTGPFDVDKNCIIVAKSIKNDVKSDFTSHEIDNIDKIKPSILSLESSAILLNGFDINFKSIDNESGMKTIKIYNNDQYVTSIVYNEKFNEEKNSTYTFTGLESNTSYKIRIQAVDVAGNTSLESEIDVTTGQEKIVAQIIGRNGLLYTNEEEYENFSLLQYAIDDCSSNQCTIRMVNNTTESVEVLGGQDITLDLQGYTVEGITNSDYTISNSGNLIVLDTADTAGVISNKYNSSIKNINGGILQLGKNEEVIEVSENQPNIVGTTYGIYNDENSIFKFYDGKIEGNIAIKGDVNDTPYLYNANIYTEEHQIGVLKILAEAEAQIVGGKYYTLLSNAVSETENGGYADVTSEVSFLNSFSLSEGSLYGFDYNKDSNLLISNNLKTKTTAKSSAVIDLRNYNADQTLKITGYLKNIYAYSSYNKSYGSISISALDGGSYTGTNNRYSTTTSNTNKIILKKGSRYKIELQHTIPGANNYTDAGGAQFIISNMNLSEYKLDDLLTEKNEENTTMITNYGFDYDETTKTYKSNNQYKNNTVAFSYIPIDLTNEQKNKLVIVNASLDTISSYNIGNILVKEENSMLSSYSSSNALYTYPNSSSSDTPDDSGILNYTKELTAGKKYYLQFYYFKNNANLTEEDYKNANSTDTFTINSIDIVDAINTTPESLLSTIETAEGATYGYDKYISGNQLRNITPANKSASTGTVAHGYIKIDLTNSKIDKYVSTKVSSSNTKFYMTVTDNKELPDSTNAFINAEVNSYDDNYPIYGKLEKGKVNYVHLVYTKTSSYYPYIYSLDVLEGDNINLISNLKKSGQYGYDKFDSYYSAYYPSKYGQYILTDSYVKIDLTNKEEDQILRINANLYGSGNAKYFYLTSNINNVNYSYIGNNKNNALLHYTGKYYYPDYYGYKNYDYVLKKGNVYYLHIANYGLTSYGYDYAYLRSITLHPVTNNLLNIGTLKVNKGTEEYIEQKDETITIDENKGNEFRYISSKANNYIKFNNELWRIIGVFDTKDKKGNVDKRIKIVRNSSIGNYSWDSSENASETAQDTNAGLGINEWSQADIMKLMNPGYEDETVGGSLYWNSSSGNCYTGIGNETSSCDFTTTGLSEESRNMIDTVEWYTGALPQDNLGSLTPEQIYSYERDTNTGKTNYENLNGLPVDNIERTYTWFGKVGLMYTSDYIFTGDYYSSTTREYCMNTPSYGTCVSNNSWFRNIQSSAMFTINPLYAGNAASTNYSPFFGVQLNTGLSNYPVGYAASTYPTVYLSKKVNIVSGNGTSSNPYIIELNENDNPDEYYGLNKSDETDLDTDNVITEETTNNDYEKIFERDVYGFEYNEDTKIYTNLNSDIAYSLASGYAKIDLTNHTKSQDIIINYNLSSSSDFAYARLFTDEFKVLPYNYYGNSCDDNGNCYGTILSVNRSGSNKTTITLNPGHVYYIQFVYDRRSENIPTEEITNTFKISFEYVTETEEKEEYTRYDKTIPVLNEKPDIVRLLKDVSLTETLTIEETRNVELDLAGHTLTTTANDYVITNNGQLKIFDSTYVENLEKAEEKYQKESQEAEEKYQKELQEAEDKYNEEIKHYNENYKKIELTEENFTHSVYSDVSDISATFEEDGIKTTFIHYNTWNCSVLYYNEKIVVTEPMTISGKLLVDATNISNYMYVYYGLSNDTEIDDNYVKSNYAFVRTPDSVEVEFSIDIETKGEYYFKIYLKPPGSGNNNKQTAVYKLKELNISPVLPVKSEVVKDEVSKDEVNIVGNVTSTTNGVILNNQNASLDLSGAIVNLNKNSYTFNAITNKGNLKLSNNAIVNVSYQGNTAIYNDESGIILDSDGIINLTSTFYQYGIKNYNPLNNTIKGFSIYANNTSNTPIIISYVENGNLELNNIKVVTPGLAVDGYYSDVVIKNSFFQTTGTPVYDAKLIKNSNNMDIINCNIISAENAIYNAGTINLIDSNIEAEDYSLIYDNYSEPSKYAEINITKTSITGGMSIYYTNVNHFSGTLNGSVRISNGNGTYTIGTKDSNMIKDVAIVNGFLYLHSGKLRMYDGYIKYSKDPIQGVVSDVENGYQINIETTDDGNIASLVEVGNVAKIGDTEFKSVQSAIDSISTSDETQIDIISDISEISTYTIPTDRNVKLNLNGHKIDNYTSGSLIINDGILSLIDSSENESSLIESYSNELITNNGTLNILSGNYLSDYANIIVNNKILNISGGTYTQNKDDSAIILNEGSETNVNGGIYTITKTSKYAKYIFENSGNLIINKITTNLNGVYTSIVYNESTGILDFRGTLSYSSTVKNNMLIYNTGDATISNLTFPSGYFINTKNLELNNLTMKYGLNLYNSGGIVNINKGKYSGKISNGVYAESFPIYTPSSSNSGQTININGSTINTTIEQTIYNRFGVVNITDSNITTSSSRVVNSILESAITNIYNSNIKANKQAIYIEDGTINMYSGTVNCTSDYGIYNLNVGTVNLGTKDGIVSKDSPAINGNTYGIYNRREDAIFNFYDGYLYGTTAIYGTVSDIEDEYEIILEETNGKEKKFLDVLPVAKIESTGLTYGSLQEAINAVTENEETIYLLRELTTIETAESTNIPEDKNIIFDLNSYNIYANNSDFLINNGTLKIKDGTSSSSQIIGNGIRIIKNNGTLTIESGTYKSEIYMTDNSLILNNGTMNIIGGKYSSILYTGENTTKGLFINSESSTMSVSGSASITIKGTDNAIYNMGNLILDGGTIIAEPYNNIGNGVSLYNTSLGIVQINKDFTFSDSYGNKIINNFGDITINETIIKTGIIDNQSKLTFNNATYNYYGHSSFISNKGNAELNIYGGTYKSGISNADNANVNIYNNATFNT